jgi:hypothetical protein
MADPLPLAVPEDCRLVSLSQIPEPRGNLTVLEELAHLPFRIGSVRWFYDVSAGTSCSADESDLGDALIVALSGSFDVVIDQPGGRSRVPLSRAYTGLQVPAGVRWRVDEPSTNSEGLVISSEPNRPRRLGSDQLDEGVPAALNLDSTIDDCRPITLSRRRRLRGSTSIATPQSDVPFDIRRVYHLYDVPGGARRRSMHTDDSKRCSSRSRVPSMSCSATGGESG